VCVYGWVGGFMRKKLFNSRKATEN